MKKPTDKKLPKKDAKDLRIEELTVDLQRLRADFENYRKNADEQKIAMRQFGAEEMLKKFLGVVDNIERAVKNVPQELQDNAWVQGVENLGGNLDKILSEIGVERIDASAGAEFNHEIHNAVVMDEAEGETEVIAEELQAGYKLDGKVLREAMVRVTKK
jgi:molecular chaperone GrpE